VTWNTAVSFRCRFPCITSRTVQVRQQIHVYIVQKITWHCWRPDSRLKPIPGDDAIFCVRSNADYWQASMLNVRHRADMIMGWVDPCLGWVELGWVEFQQHTDLSIESAYCGDCASDSFYRMIIALSRITYLLTYLQVLSPSFYFCAMCNVTWLLTDDYSTVSWRLFNVFLRNVIKVNVRVWWWVGLGWVGSVNHGLSLVGFHCFPIPVIVLWNRLPVSIALAENVRCY